jgi:hypothetical protein
MTTGLSWRRGAAPGPARLRGSSGFGGPTSDRRVSVETIHASLGEQHAQIGMTHQHLQNR